MASRTEGNDGGDARVTEPHDKLFREAMSNAKDAAALLRAVLPAALVAELDLDELRVEPGTFVDEELRRSQSDVLLKARYRGREAYVYVLFEHKSGADRWTVLQVLRYLVRIWERELASEPAPRTLSPVIPVIVHHGDRPWASPVTFQELFEAEVMGEGGLGELTPSFGVLVDDLTELSDEALVQRALSDFGVLALWALRDGRRGAEKILAGLQRLGWALQRLWAGPNGKRAMTLMVTYIFGVSQEMEPARLRETLEELVPGAEELVMTVAERLKREGLERGLQQGREEGLQQGLQQGREEGREEGLRTAFAAIEALCEVLGIELTAVRRSALGAMSATELTSLLDALRHRRRWPEH